MRVGCLVVAVEARQEIVGCGRGRDRILVLRLCVPGSLQTGVHGLQVGVLVFATVWVQIIVARHAEG